MANVINFIQTNAADELISKVLNGKTLNFTRMAVGDGFSYDLNIAKGFTTLVNEVLSLDITKKETLSAKSIKITSAFKNTDAQKEFYYREVGLYAQDPDTGEEVLYAYGNRNDTAELITPTGAIVVTKQLAFVISVGDSAKVTFNVNAGVYALQEDVTTLQANLDELNRTKANQTDLAIESARITNLAKLTQGSTTGDAELIDGRVNSVGTIHQTVGNSIRYGQTGLLLDYDDMPLSKGYKKFVNFPFAKTSVNVANGTDSTDNISIATLSNSLISLNGDIGIINNNVTKYRIKIYKYNQDGSYVGVDKDWTSQNIFIFTPSLNYKYRFQIATRDSSNIVIEDALHFVLFVNDNDKIPTLEEIASGSTILYDYTSMSFGCKSKINLKFESGGVTASNGNDDSSTNCARIGYNNKFSPTEKFYVVNKNTTLYRTRVIEYSNNTTFVSSTEWSSLEKYKIEIVAGHLYRVVVANYDGSVINVENVQKSIACFLESEILTSNTNRVEDNFLYLEGKNTANTISFLPEYWETYLKTKVNTIRGYLTNGIDKSIFLAITDTHYHGTGLNDINPSIPKYLADRLNINMILHLGDINAENTDANTSREYMEKPMRLLQSAVRYVFPIRGNHDDNIEGSRGWNDGLITQSDSYSLMFRNLKDVSIGKTGTYYYYDNAFECTRFIFLDSTDFIYSNTKDKTLPDEKILAFGFEQLKWLCETLKNTPNEYFIVIAVHSMLADSNVTRENPSNVVQTKAINYLTVSDILKAYKNREAINITCTGSNVSKVHPEYYNGMLNYSFSNCDATIVGVLSGHEHVDCIEEIKDSSGNGIGIYNTCMQGSSTLFPDTVISSSYQSSMTLGTTTEYIYDVFIIDKKNKHVDIIRIGAGDSTENRGFNFS